MNKLYLIETGFIGIYNVDIYLTDDLDDAKKQARILLKKFKEFYPNIQFINEDDWYYSTEDSLAPDTANLGSVYIQIREIEISFEYSKDNTLYLTENCCVAFGFYTKMKRKYPKIEKYLESISPKPLTEHTQCKIFDTKSNAEKYIEPENKKHSDNNDRFYRVTPFKIRIPIRNIDKSKEGV